MLGYPHPRHLLRELSSKEVTEWMAYYETRPFGFVRESQLFGTLAAQQYQMHKSKGPDRGPFDFFPVTIRPRDSSGRDTSDTIIKLFKAYNLQQGYAEDGKTKLTQVVKET